MKFAHILFCSSVLIMFSSCKKEEDPALVNTWKLIEILADPGDGSGTFQPVNSNKTISFFADGIVSSNGELCQMSAESGSGSSGMYSESDRSITPNNCGISPFTIYYEFDGSHLILNYPCIEACREKYELQ